MPTDVGGQTMNIYVYIANNILNIYKIINGLILYNV